MGRARPLSVLAGGRVGACGVGDGGVLFRDGSHRAPDLRLTSLDAGLVSPGPAANMDLYSFPGYLPRATDGVAWSLWNNLW